MRRWKVNNLPKEITVNSIAGIPDAALTHTSRVRFPWLVCMSKIYPEYLRLKLKKSRGWNRFILLELLAIEVLQTSHTSQAVACALGLPPELGGKAIVMKTPSAWVRDHADIKQVLTWKLHPYWLLSYRRNVLSMLLERKRNQESYPAVNPVTTIMAVLARYVHLCYRGKENMGMTNHSMIWFKDLSTAWSVVRGERPLLFWSQLPG